MGRPKLETRNRPTQCCFNPRAATEAAPPPKKKKSLEMRPTSLMTGTTMQTPNQGCTGDRGLRAGHYSSVTGKTGLPNVYGERCVGGKTHWLCRPMTQSSGELASCPESRNKPATFTPGHKFLCTPHHRRQMSARRRKGKPISTDACVKMFKTHHRDDRLPHLQLSISAFKLPELCAHAECSGQRAGILP